MPRWSLPARTLRTWRSISWLWRTTWALRCRPPRSYGSRAESGSSAPFATRGRSLRRLSWRSPRRPGRRPSSTSPWQELSPGIRADLRCRIAIAGPVDRRLALETESRLAKKHGIEDWAAEAVQREQAAIDDELATELRPALLRRMALVEELADEAAALRAGQSARITVTSMSRVNDCGHWPGVPRQPRQGAHDRP